MKKYLSILLGILLLAGGCSWSSFNPFAGKEKTISAEDGGVNHYLWQASLDKLGFMPIDIEDKSGGVIVTGWIRMQKNPNDLYKIKVKVMCRELRSDGLSVWVEKRQIKDGKTYDVKADKALAAGIKNQILQQARILYQNDLVKV
ncbi:MAG: DUF3576 domain-containing protein [Alphaproteobacteria bacterium]|nr:DUF3576 domain-containing protein [Alphaproteobacteria bacterium]